MQCSSVKCSLVQCIEVQCSAVHLVEPFRTRLEGGVDSDSVHAENAGDDVWMGEDNDPVVVLHPLVIPAMFWTPVSGWWVYLNLKRM